MFTLSNIWILIYIEQGEIILQCLPAFIKHCTYGTYYLSRLCLAAWFPSRHLTLKETRYIWGTSARDCQEHCIF